MRIFIDGTHDIVSYFYHHCNGILGAFCVQFCMNFSPGKLHPCRAETPDTPNESMVIMPLSMTGYYFGVGDFHT